MGLGGFEGVSFCHSGVVDVERTLRLGISFCANLRFIDILLEILAMTDVSFDKSKNLVPKLISKDQHGFRW